MRQFCLGEAYAFEELYRRHSGRIYGFLKSRVSDQSMVEDIFQETFLKVCKNRAKFQPDFPFLPWFFTLCRNTMLDALRADKKVSAALVDADSLTAPDSIPDSVFNLEAAPGYLSYLESLNQRERKILELHFIQDLPFKSVARQLGMSGPAVRKISSRAIRKLRAIWRG